MPFGPVVVVVQESAPDDFAQMAKGRSPGTEERNGSVYWKATKPGIKRRIKIKVNG